MQNIFRFIKSSIRFIKRVIERSIAAIVLWVIDISEVYSKLITTRLSKEYVASLQPYIHFLDIITPWIAGVIILWAILYTYYEIERELIRDVNVGKNLKKLYCESGDLLKRQIASEQELSTLKQDYDTWLRKVYHWIEENMESASLTRFLHSQFSMPYNHGRALNDSHQIILNSINIYHKNLQAIIESQEWK